MIRAFLSLGSNLGDSRQILTDAVETLGEWVTAVSPVYETDPIGRPEQAKFLNLVVEVAADRTPHELLAVCHRLESAANRVRQERWGPRTLDVDIVLIEGVRVDDADLQVPHPRMTTRRFVLAPLADLAPELVDPDLLARSHGRVRPAGHLPGWGPPNPETSHGIEPDWRDEPGAPSSR